jgi:spore coat polysaccharide biosynthesis protein SpsF
MTSQGKARVVATIEARMGSSRLPGKVLMPALGEPMLMHLVRRLRAVPSIDNIVIATTTKEGDTPIVDFCAANDITCFRGSEDDVLARVIAAGESDSAEVLVEITGDCPVIDPDLVEQTIRMYFHHDVDYASNSIVRSYPIGMDTQVISMAVLKGSAELTDDPLDREHVSRYLWQRPDQYRFAHLVSPPSLHWPGLALTLDEPGDYLLLKKIIETLAPTNPLFSCLDMIRLLRANPSWLDLNSSVLRKGAN